MRGYFTAAVAHYYNSNRAVLVHVVARLQERAPEEFQQSKEKTRNTHKYGAVGYDRSR